MKKFLKSKVGQPIPEREGSVYEPIIDRAYGKYAAVYGLTNAYTIIGPKNGTGEIAIVAGTQQGGMPCSDLKSASFRVAWLTANVKFLAHLKLIAKTSFHKYSKIER